MASHHSTAQDQGLAKAASTPKSLSCPGVGPLSESPGPASHHQPCVGLGQGPGLPACPCSPEDSGSYSTSAAGGSEESAPNPDLACSIPHHHHTANGGWEEGHEAGHAEGGLPCPASKLQPPNPSATATRDCKARQGSSPSKPSKVVDRSPKRRKSGSKTGRLSLWACLFGAGHRAEERPVVANACVAVGAGGGKGARKLEPAAYPQHTPAPGAPLQPATTAVSDVAAYVANITPSMLVPPPGAGFGVDSAPLQKAGRPTPVLAAAASPSSLQSPFASPGRAHAARRLTSPEEALLPLDPPLAPPPSSICNVPFSRATSLAGALPAQGATTGTCSTTTAAMTLPEGRPVCMAAEGGGITPAAAATAPASRRTTVTSDQGPAQRAKTHEDHDTVMLRSIEGPINGGGAGTGAMPGLSLEGARRHNVHEVPPQASHMGGLEQQQQSQSAASRRRSLTSLRVVGQKLPVLSTGDLACMPFEVMLQQLQVWGVGWGGCVWRSP